MFEGQHLRSFRLDNYFEEEYLNNIPALKHLKAFTFSKPVTFFIGENGSGKSTLLEALAVQCGFNAEGGTKNFTFATKETHSTLYRHLKITKGIPFPSEGFFLRAESFYNVATEIEELAISGKGGIYGKEAFYHNNYGGKSLHEQSHGESFLSLVLNRFQGNSIFFLDEPEAALSPSRQLTLLARMHQLVGENAQFIISTHSPILMSYPNADIIEITEHSAKITPYKETEHYTLTKQFLNHPESMLHYLLEEDVSFEE